MKPPKSHTLTKVASQQLAKEMGDLEPSIAIATLDDGVPMFFAPADKTPQYPTDIPESERINPQTITTFLYQPTSTEISSAKVKPLTCVTINGNLICW